MSRSEKHEITVYLHAETDRAWLVNESAAYNRPPTGHVWLPKSQCDEIRRSVIPHPNAGTGVLAKDAILGEQITLAVPEWLVEQSGFEALI